MTEKPNRQFAVSTIYDVVENAPLIYELDMVHPDRAADPRRTRDLLLPRLLRGKVSSSDAERGE